MKTKYKIYYIHGTMFSGKSLDLISTYTTYRFSDKNVLVLKHASDTRDMNVIKSRMSNETVDCVLYNDDDSLYEVVINSIKNNDYKVDVILIDEIQFSSVKHIEELDKISKIAPVMCYGLKTSYTGELFPAIAKLIPLAEDVKEIKTTCSMCNSKASHNLLIRNNKPVYEGAFVNIEGDNSNDKYLAVCREHFYNPILDEDDTHNNMEVVESNLTFGLALDTIKGSVKELGMRLPHWNKDTVVKIQIPTDSSKMTAPYLYVESKNSKVPWKENMIELFAENWEIVTTLTA